MQEFLDDWRYHETEIKQSQIQKETKEIGDENSLFFLYYLMIQINRDFWHVGTKNIYIQKTKRTEKIASLNFTSYQEVRMKFEMYSTQKKQSILKIKLFSIYRKYSLKIILLNENSKNNFSDIEILQKMLSYGQQFYRQLFILMNKSIIKSRIKIT